jgi:medium-chain acyl-[acyl-carrier-protein] hydrolase
MGAALAYHLARQLAAQGAGPAGLIVSGRRAPHLPQSRPAHHELAEDVLVDEMLRADPDSQLWLRPHWRRPYLALLQADSAALERLGPQPTGALEQPILAYHGSRDPWVSAFEIQEWRRATRGAFELRHYDGAHSDHHLIRHEVMAHVMANGGLREEERREHRFANR